MNIDAAALEAKIREIYPEIAAHGLAVSATFEKEADAWLVRIRAGGDEVSTRIDAADAEACLSGRQCMKLAAQVGSFMNVHCAGATACVR
ncbi:MAG: hypothetical protein AB1916_07705 [Thermodesulfobacteriota bacterium]